MKNCFKICYKARDAQDFEDMRIPKELESKLEFAQFDDFHNKFQNSKNSASNILMLANMQKEKSQR